MHGYIDEQLNPMVEDISVVGKTGNLQLEAVLDTGFNGMFSLPKKYFLLAI